MIKRIALSFTLLLLGLLFSSCQFFATTTAAPSTSYITSATTTTATSDSELTTAFSTVTSSLTDMTSNTSVPLEPTGYETVQDVVDVVGIPSTGNQKILVFAVEFPDYPASQCGVSITDIEKAFNGSSSDLAYESLQSYYEKSSYGQLTIQADVYGYYMASQPSTYYENEYEKLYAWDDIHNTWLYGDDEVTYPDSDLIYEVLTAYDDIIDYSDYDSNNDGYIDGIYIIYTAPVDYENDSLWWAYSDVYFYTDQFDGTEPYWFVWSGTDFFLEGNEGLNARTIIHETGHMLGLEDYYDYDTSDRANNGGLGGADMMDNTEGDQNPFSKLLLGWITPMVVTTSMRVDLTPFLEDGEVILLIDQWNNTLFDEYLLISYYTPDGLNSDINNIYFTEPGVIIYHVNAVLGSAGSDTAYPSIYRYNNTDTTYKLIAIIEADQDGDIDRYRDFNLDGYNDIIAEAENADLFQTGDILGSTIDPAFAWDNGTPLGFTVGIVSLDASQTVIQIQATP